MSTSSRIRWSRVGRVLVALMFVLAAGSADAKRRPAQLPAPPPPPPPPPPPWYQYSVPFTCGTAGSGNLRAVAGDYAVTIQLMNTYDVNARIRKQVRLTYPPGAETPGIVSDVIRENLPGERAMQVSCDELLGEFVYPTPLPTASTRPLVQGFLVIRTDVYLDVSVSHSSGTAGGVSQDVEVVVGRPIPNREYVPDGEVDSVVICHRPPGNPGNAHTIEVGASAWPAHAAHGDTRGVCPHGDDD